MNKKPSAAGADLFAQRRDAVLSSQSPLADRMRPRTLDEYVGQRHILGAGRLLRRAIQADQLSSLIFYGPPGTGKTTLARIIANTTKSQFLSINAVLAGVQDIRDAIEQAKKTLELYGRRTILFVDEVHRFNKAQQDALLPHVENGLLILIGATTENPYFEVNKALVSRSRIFQLKGLTTEELAAVARQALADKERGYGNRRIEIDDDALEHLVTVANGDARGVLNALELAVETTDAGADGVIHIDRSIAEESIQQRAVLYDKDGDAHYDTISAFIKSVRGSDPDAALYWMAKMVYAGEHPRFIFRRLLILACEDIGMADPNALTVVMNAAQAFEYVGLPEGRFHLAHACLYCATAPKSNSSLAFFDILEKVSKEASDEVPIHLRDSNRDAEGFGDGKGYLYPHAFRDHWVAQQYLPESLQGKVFYQPSDQGFEQGIRERVLRHREAQVEAMVAQDTPDLLASGGGGGEGSAQWMARTAGGGGEQLAKVRDRLMEIAGVGRDSLVLDANARTGLITFEAARLAVNGGVWALAHDDQSRDTIVRMAGQLPELQRPRVLRTSWSTFDDDIRAADGQVRFSVILGRNIVGGQGDKVGLVGRMAGLLDKGGVLALAETVPSGGQRLSALLGEAGLSRELLSAVVSAEEALFGDPADPLVNWDGRSLERDLSAIAGVSVKVSVSVDQSARKLTPAEVDHWFRTAGAGERLSLGQRLAAVADKKAVAAVRQSLHRRLDHQQVQWQTSTAFVRVSRV